jgi:hypothetical protein
MNGESFARWYSRILRYMPSPAQKGAMAGATGTPSASNRFVTEDDMAEAGAVPQPSQSHGSELHDPGWPQEDEMGLLRRDAGDALLGSGGRPSATNRYACEGQSILRLASATVDMRTAGKTNLLVVPSGKTLYVAVIIVRDLSASLAGGVDYDFGTGANCDTWRQSVDLSSMTSVEDYMFILGADLAKYTREAAASVFGIKVITGATDPATAVVDLFGFIA